MTKYAEHLTYPCGTCTYVVDLGSITDEQIDPGCETHQEAPCLVCGEMEDQLTIAHGSFGKGFHTVIRKELV